MKYVFLFPGQGAQYPGMGKDFYEAFAASRQTFEQADDLLKENLSKIIFDGPESELTKTKYSQCAIFVVSAAILRAMPEMKPAVCAGLSLGEYTALWASGRLSFEETLLLIQKRAQFMNDACENVSGTMAAVLGMADVESALQGIPGVWVANYNCPGQIVISGTKEGVAIASEQLRAKGAKRIIPLQVHGAFHSGLMQGAQDALAPYIAAANIRESNIGFVMNATGDFAGDVKKNLTCQVTSSVRWDQGILAIEKTKPDKYLEIGCGKTLTALNKKIGVAAPTISVEKVGDLDLCNC
jgi:[acyl-carrier-protein] S-malonyltransferase